jgi:hypothetical protein
MFRSQVVEGWEDKRDLARRVIKNRREVDERVAPSSGIISVNQFPTLQSVFDALNHCLISVPVVDNSVTFGGIEHASHVVLCLPSNSDDRMYV